MKQTAVEWMVEQLRMQTPLYTKDEIINQAKEMEKQQIIDAVDMANKKWRSSQVELILDGKQYFNKTFQKK